MAVVAAISAPPWPSCCWSWPPFSATSTSLPSPNRSSRRSQQTQTQPAAPAAQQRKPRPASPLQLVLPARRRFPPPGKRDHGRERVLQNRPYQSRGLVKHWILKKYFDSTGKPLDMVQPQAAARFGLPLSLFTYDPALTTSSTRRCYQVTVTGATPTATGRFRRPPPLPFTTRPMASML